MKKRSEPIFKFQLFLQPDWGPVQPTYCSVLSRQHMMMVVMSFLAHPDQTILLPLLRRSASCLPGPCRITHHLTVTTSSACNPTCNHLFITCTFYLLHQ